MWRICASGALSAASMYALSGTAMCDSPHDEKVPGVYVWGRTGSTNLQSPQRIGYFDKELMNDVASDPSGHLFAFCTQKGNVVQWDPDAGLPQPSLSGRNIHQVRVSNGVIYGLAKSGRVYSWDRPVESSTGSWWKFWSRGNTSPALIELKVPRLGWWEKIAEIDTGKDHILARTNKGRVFSGSTGVKAPKESKGQFGIASMSQFDSPPAPGALHEIKLLQGNNITNIAAGDYHSLVLSDKGHVFGFGENIYGQLARPFSQRAANIAVPEQIAVNLGKVSSIAAGGGMSYLTVRDPQTNDLQYYSFGNGLAGQMGTGKFAHAQPTPQRIRPLEDLREYSESLKKVVQIPVKSLSVSATHTIATLASSDVLVWGGSMYYQLGTGKKSTVSTPSSIPPLDVARDAAPVVPGAGPSNGRLQLQAFGKIHQHIYAGDGVSVLYYKK